ncbi:MAG: HEAT repeat domain-containing protein [Sandaracinus sp.]
MKLATLALSLLLLLAPAARVVAQDLTPDEYQAAVTQLASAEATERSAAATTLGRRGRAHRAEIVPTLRQLLREDPQWEVRAAAGQALGRLAARDAVPDLVRALRDPVVDVRVVAAAAIWRLPDPAAVPALVELLADADHTARDQAALALGVIRDTRATTPLSGLLHDPDATVRLDVVRSLGRIRDRAALEPLETFVRESRDAEERAEGINAIAALEAPERMDALGRLLDHTDRGVRQHAAEALGQVGDALVLPTLRHRLTVERVPQVRSAITAAIAAVEARAATPPTTTTGG